MNTTCNCNSLVFSRAAIYLLLASLCWVIFVHVKTIIEYPPYNEQEQIIFTGPKVTVDGGKFWVCNDYHNGAALTIEFDEAANEPGLLVKGIFAKKLNENL